MTFAVLLLVGFLSFLLLGLIAVLVALLANPKTRTMALAVLRVGGMVVAVVVIGAFLWWTAIVGEHRSQRIPRVVESPPAASVKLPDIAAEMPPPESAAPAPAATAEKGEDAYSRAVATRTVGMLRAMVRALSSALVEEEKDLAMKKGEAPPPSAPAKNAPAWVGSNPQLVGDTYQMAVVVGPYTTRQECDAKLPEELRKAVGHYAAMCLGNSYAADVSLPADFLRQHVVKGEWEEVRRYSVGPMVQLHVLLAFDRQAKDRIVEEHQRGVVARRLWLAGVGLSAVLLLIAVFHGYLRADLATGGAYRRSLRFAVIMAILVVAVAVVLGVGRLLTASLLMPQ